MPKKRPTAADTTSAVLRVTGDTHNLEPAALYLYREWLPVSGEEIRDFPIYCRRFFLDEPEQGTAAELDKEKIKPYLAF